MRNAWQVARDPFATTAERCAAGLVDPFHPSTGRVLTDVDPKRIAYRGFDPGAGPRSYYLAGGIWRDTLTDLPWEGSQHG